MAVKQTAEVTVIDQTDATALILWYHSTTSATAPSAPTTTDASATPTGWTKVEPTISSDADLAKYVYSCLQTVWGDGTCDWGDVTLSASFEAAKRAYNRTVANATAIERNEQAIALRATKTEVDALGVGGRNYVTEKVNGYLQNGKVLALANASTTYNERTTTFIAVAAGEVLDMEVWLDGADSSQPWIAYHFLSDSTTVLTNRVAKYGTAGDTYIAYKGVEVPTGATLVRMSWRENSTGARAQLTKDTDSSIVRAEATLEVHADQIDARVEKDGVIAAINASVEEEGGSAVQISANKVNIEGAAIFTGSGRLSQTSLDSAYDANGAAYQASQPNLSPFFESVPYTTDSGYWMETPSSTLTPIGDGWARFSYDNSGGSSTVNRYFRMASCPSVIDGGSYTILVEFRNVSVTGSTGGYLYSQQSSYSQIWGDGTYGGFGIKNSDIAALDGGAGEFRIQLTALGVSEHATTGERLMHVNWQMVAGASISADIRISLYEGEYSGAWKPYSGNLLYASQTELSTKADSADLNASRSWYAECPTAAATGQKAATISPATTAFTTDVLTPGTTVYVKFSNTNSAAAGDLYLNVNQTGDYPIRYIYNGSLSNIPAGQLKANQIYLFYFDGTYWVVEMIYNTNTNDTAWKINYRNNILAGENLVASSLIGAHEDNKYYQLSGSNDYFLLSHPLLWLNKAVTADTANYADVFTQLLDLNLGTYYTSFAGGSPNSIVYLVGTVSGNKFILNGSNSSQYLTCTPPTTANGKVYVPIGRLGNQSNGKTYFNYAVATPVTIYAFIDGAFRQATPTDIIATQRIYYRTTAAATLTGPTTWVDTATNVYGSWTTKVPPLAASTADGQTKYPYLYTCEQRRRIDGTVSCTAVTLDENTTVIDGGNIITNSVTANQLNASSINAWNQLTVGAFTSGTQADVLNSNVTVGGRNLIPSSRFSSNGIAGSTRELGPVALATLHADFNNNGTYLLNGFEANTQYTFRVGALAENPDQYTGTYKGPLFIFRYTDGSTYTVEFFYAEQSVVYKTYTTDSGKSLDKLCISYARGGNWTFYEMKLERGNRATDWSPAPEDTDAAIGASSAREQTIYRSAEVGTATMSANTTWVTDTSATAGQQNMWTAKRPQYDQDYPVLFVATQRQTVAQQAAGTSCSCTTPVIDDTTTVIDGGNIITGTVTANKISVSELSALGATIGGFTIDDDAIYSGTSVESAADSAVALSSADFTRSIGGTSRSNLRLALGGKFGVDKQGNLYANGATLTNLTVGGSSSNVYSKTEADSAIGTAVDGIEVGGRNLLRTTGIWVSGTWNTSTGAHTSSSNRIRSTYGGHYVPVEPGQRYTVSRHADSGIQYDVVLYAYDSSGAFVSADSLMAWQTSFPFSYVPATATRLEVGIRRHDDSNLNAGAAADAKIKIEKGNKATDWSLAPEDVDAASYQASQSNLTPWFSSDVSRYTTSNAATDDYFWYRNNDKASFTDMGDGWCRVVLDNTSGTGLVRTDYVAAASEGIECGRDYTFLMEFRNNNSVAPSSEAVKVYTVQQGTPVSVQFWGDGVAKVLEGKGSAGTTTLAVPSGSADFAPSTSGTYVKRYVRTSNAADSSYYDRAGFKGLCCLVAYVPKGGKYDCEMRVSVYPGEYTGPYKPYSGSKLYASHTDAKGYATDAASDAVNGLEIGGRNLLLKTGSENSYVQSDATGVERRWLWYQFFGPSTFDRNVPTFTHNGSDLTNNTPGLRVFCVTSTGGLAKDDWGNSTDFGLDFEVGETYTFSCDAKTSGNRIALSMQYYNGSSGYAHTGITEFTPADTDWHRYSYTFTIPSTFVCMTALGVYCQQLQDITLSVRNPKLERGNKPTDWTAAPEDTDAAIASQSYQASQPNLTPFFEMPQGNLYDATTNPSGYWRKCGVSNTSLITTWDFGQTTADGAGWAHIEGNNTSSGAAYGHFWVSKYAQALKPSTDYTFLIEWRDVTLSGNVSVQCPTAHGGTNGVNDDFFTSTKTTSLTAGSGSAYVTATTRASYESACVSLVRAQVALPKNATLSGYIRVSLYEGEYSGPYKPYSGATLYASHTDLDSMEIGGRNLLRHSDKLEDAIWWVRRNVSTIQTGQTDPSGNLEAVKVTPSSTDWYLANRKPMPKLTEVGAPYTASVWLKADSETTCNLCVRYLKSDWVDGNTATSTTRKTVTVTTEWQRFSVTGTLMTAVTNDHAFWIGQATNAALYAYHPKLERGTKATDWTPAPEDTDGIVESGTNLLYDADAPTLDPVNGPAARYFSDSGNASFIACDIRQVENPPETGIRNMAHWSVTSTAHGISAVGKYRGICFYNGNYIQFVAGQTYTASCWVRCTSGKFDIRIGAYSGSIAAGTGLTTIDSGNGTGWTRWTVSFKAVSTKLDRIYFIAITIAGGLDFEADMCGFRLVAGDSAESVQSNLTATRSWYAESSTAAGTAAKTATISPATTAFTNDILTPGTTVYVKFSNTNTATIGNVTLSVNGTEAKGIRYLANGAYGNLPAANYIRANQILALTYDGTYWVTDLSYNSNTNNYDRRLHNSYILAAGNVTSGTFACGTASGYSQVGPNVTFDLSYPILYAAAAWTSGTQYANGYEAIPGIDPNTTGTVQGVAVNKTLYLKGTVSGNMFTVAASNFLTCTVPTTEDGYCYIPLGIIANDSTSKMYFSTSSDVYAYKAGQFGLRAAQTAESYITDITNNGIWVTPSNAKPDANGAETSTTTGWHISSALDLVRLGVSMFKVWLDSNVTKVRIGDADGRHILMDGTSVSLMNVAATLAKFAASGIEFLNGAATLSAESVETEIQEYGETFTRHRTSIELTNTAIDGMTAGVRAWSQEDVYDDGPMQGTAIDAAVAQLIAGDGAALVGVDSEGSLAIKGDQLAVTYPEWDETTGESTDRTVNATVGGFASAVIGGIVLHEGTYNDFKSSAVTLEIGGTRVSAADFSRLLIEYEDSTGRRGSVVVDDPNGKTFTMQTTTANSSTGMVIRTKTANVSGDTVNTSTYSQGVYQYGKVTIGTNGSVTWASAQEIAIVKVIGFH